MPVTETQSELIITRDFNQYLVDNKIAEEGALVKLPNWIVPGQHENNLGTLTKLGKKCLCDLAQLNLCTLNGRYPEENPAAATFHCTTSSSKIDYTFVSLPLLPH